VSLVLLTPGDASGTYSFTVTSTDTTTGAFGSATGSATVGTTPASALAVTLAVSVSNGRDRNVTLKMKVKDGNQGVAGAAVVVVVRTPLGTLLNLNATTGADGSATLRTLLTSNDIGTYQVQATATSNGATGTATTTFVIR
jgi:hypothetical protein